MITRELIYEYERMLLGAKKELSAYFTINDYCKEDMAIDLIRYAVKTYLGWDSEKAANCLTLEHLKLLKLDMMINFFNPPPEIVLPDDFFYVISKLYPNKVELNLRELTVNVYKKILSGKMPRFPKGFFDAGKGVLRAIYCLQYAINQNLLFTSVEEGYKYFASMNANKFLKSQKLSAPMASIFNTPIEYYHETLDSDSQSEYLLEYYKFKKEMEKI